MMPPPAPEVTALLQKTGGDISSPDLQKYAQDKSVPYWSCTVKFYGPVKGIQAHWEYAKEKFSAIPGAKFQDGEFYKLPLTPEQFKQVHKARVRHPQPRNLFHRCALRDQSQPQRRTHLVFAHHPPNRRSRARSQQSILQGRQGFRLAGAVVQPALHLLDAGVHLHLRLPHHRTTSPPTRRIASRSRS